MSFRGVVIYMIFGALAYWVIDGSSIDFTDPWLWAWAVLWPWMLLAVGIGLLLAISRVLAGFAIAIIILLAFWLYLEAKEARDGGYD
jgi:hypothetical protein